MKAFIWTVVVIFALDAAAACFNLARGVELSPADRALGAAIHIGLAIWGVFAVTRAAT